ncbi:MAG: hypothetical protein JOY99_17360 [Sphingomonadaceae bacterium]|nr:hypothetical protein [Sphingomonadaceae bacterium]
MIVIGESAGKFVIHWDEARAAVRIETFGIWSVDDFNEFYPLVRAAYDKSRARLGYALVLVDGTKAHVQTSELIQYMQAQGQIISKPGDRVAVIVSSSLLKLQMKRVTEAVDTVQYFLSPSAADTWLNAYSANAA